MKRLIVGFAGAMVVAFGLIMPLRAEPTRVYDLAADWSDTTNPNGVWSYNKSPGTPFTNHIADYDSPSLNWYTDVQPAWADAIPQLPGHVPIWMKILSQNTQGWDQPIGSVLMHGAEATNPAVWPGVTWTSPFNGTVLISGGVWMPNDDLGRTMEWQILRDSQLKTSGTIRKSDGYSSSNLFDFANGSGGPAALVMPVSVGTVITFQADKPSGMAHILGVVLTITPATASLFISPPSGNYVTTQRFDLTLILKASALSAVGGNATLDGTDVTAAFGGCIKPGTLIAGGQTFRCPDIKIKDVFSPGSHTLSVTIDLSDGSSVSDTVTWEVLSNTEP